MKHIRTYELFESAARKTMYHATDGAYVKSILKNGLLVKVGKKRWPDNSYPKGTYMFDDRDDALRYAVLNCEDGEVLEIDVTGLKLKKDPESTEGSYFEDSNSFYTTEDIGADRVKLLEISDDEKDDMYRQYESMKHITAYKLFEFVSKVYPWKWSTSKATANRVAVFDIPGDRYMVEFIGRDYDKVYKVSFESENLGVDGSRPGDAGNAMRVLATVMDIMVSFLDEDPENEVTFIGAKGEGEDNENPSKRDRVYKQMMSGLPDNYEWKLGSDGKTISIKRRELSENKNDTAVWYHGTDSKFDKFDMSKTKNGPSAFGLWFTDDPELAKMFGSNVFEVELSYKKPKVITMDKWDSIRRQHAKDTEFFRNWKNELIAQGYDSLFVKERVQQFAGQTVRDGNMVAIFNQDDAKII